MRDWSDRLKKLERKQPHQVINIHLMLIISGRYVFVFNYNEIWHEIRGAKDAGIRSIAYCYSMHRA